MSIKLIVTDLDGTLLNSKDQVSEENCKALLDVQKQGVKVAIATGRPLQEALPYVEKVGAFPYFVGLNGCQTINLKNGKKYNDSYISIESTNKIFNIIEKLPVFFEMFCEEGVISSIDRKKYLKDCGLNSHYLKMFGDKIIYSKDCRAYAGRIYKILVPTLSKEISDKIKEKLSKYDDIISVTPLGVFIEIVPSNCNKSVGVKEICKQENIKPSEVMAFGDSENDIELLKFAGVSVATKNAMEKVKKICSKVAPSNDENGVAVSIKQLFFS